MTHQEEREILQGAKENLTLDPFEPRLKNRAMLCFFWEIKNMYFNNLDFVIVITYCILLISIALFISKTPKGTKKNAEDYFWLVDHCHGGQLAHP
ncbi:MAG: hypothetical protein CM15mP127_03040 [Gammaproteobacteria bacterium]|nr:MAG: hypothetical protein CM15mP127_03040 [Gammaproteobacteria bacterium]